MAFDYYLKQTHNTLGAVKGQTRTNKSLSFKLKKLLAQTNKQLEGLRMLLTDTTRNSQLPDLSMIEICLKIA